MPQMWVTVSSSSALECHLCSSNVASLNTVVAVAFFTSTSSTVASPIIRSSTYSSSRSSFRALKLRFCPGVRFSMGRNFFWGGPNWKHYLNAEIWKFLANSSFSCSSYNHRILTIKQITDVLCYSSKLLSWHWLAVLKVVQKVTVCHFNSQQGGQSAIHLKGRTK